MNDSRNLDISKFTFSAIESPGVSFIERKLIPFSKINIRPMQDNNCTRSKGKSASHVDILMHSFSQRVDYSQMPPVVYKIPPKVDYKGDIVEYEIFTGHHRKEALERLGYDSWVFDVYNLSCEDYTFDDVLHTFQLNENNHAPRLPSTEDDVVKTVTRLIQRNSKLIKPENDSIWNYVNTTCSHLHYNTRAKIVRDVERNLQQNGHMPLYDIVTYLPEDVDNFIKQKTNLKTRGLLDLNLDQHGWTVLEGYEKKCIMNIVDKFGDTGKISYITLYTKSPTEDMSLSDRVEKTKETINDLGLSILKCADYYKKHGKMPWYIKGRLPQDRDSGEDEYINFD